MATGPTMSNLLMWTGALNAVAVFTFAFENSLFFMFPHHERSQGIAMLIRAKLMFVAKLLLFVAGIGMLYGWVAIVRWGAGSWQIPAIVAGGIGGSWAFALAALGIAARCWQRFDLAADTPPE